LKSTLYWGSSNKNVNLYFVERLVKQEYLSDIKSQSNKGVRKELEAHHTILLDIYRVDKREEYTINQEDARKSE
jgi:hypothetical protein